MEYWKKSKKELPEPPDVFVARFRARLRDADMELRDAYKERRIALVQLRDEEGGILCAQVRVRSRDYVVRGPKPKPFTADGLTQLWIALADELYAQVTEHAR